MIEQKSQKGASDIVMKRKIYQQLLDWKGKRNGEVALLVEGARRIGKSYIVEEFGKNEYENIFPPGSSSALAFGNTSEPFSA